MSSNTAIPTPVWNKFHSTRPHQKPRPKLPIRPATSPTLPTTPANAKHGNDRHDYDINETKNHRWSEIVPPATALTFAAVWDPEEGLVTFGGASLSVPENGGSNDSPEDAEAHSQVLSVDFLHIGNTPDTAKDSTLFPYSQSRFAASELSSQRFPISPTRRSSVGTGIALDSSISPVHVEKRTPTRAQYLRSPSPQDLGTLRADSPSSTVTHRYTTSQDVAAAHGLSTLGIGICNAFRRVKPLKEGLSRPERPTFLRRAPGKESYLDSERRGEKVHSRVDDSDSPKSAGLRSIFARSIWLRGGIGFNRDGGLVCQPPSDDVHDSITLDSGFDHLDIDEGGDETWLGDLGSENDKLEYALRRDVTQLKSAFSWTTTSTSRYVDVAAFLDMDSDTDSTVSSLGVPLASTVSPFHSQVANSASVHAREGDCNSDQVVSDHPIPHVKIPHVKIPVSTRPKPYRRVLRKPSKTRLATPVANATSRHNADFGDSEDQHRYQMCPKCHLRIETADPEDEDEVRRERVVSFGKGKGRVNSQPDLPDCIRNTVSFGRPATARAFSSPASVPFMHVRSRSLPGSGAATPAEVLSRASYNHEWATPVSSRPISHVRSPSAPQQGSPVTSMSMRRSPTPTRTCQHITDVRDVLRGMQSGIRPSTPIPGMPPVPSKNRPPPTSFRPVSAGGRERGRSRTPNSSAVQSHSALYAGGMSLTRSQSHTTSNPPASGLRSRTRSLESLRGAAHALASVSTAPIRSLWRSRSFLRNLHDDSPGKYVAADDDEDGEWVCVDIKATGSKQVTAHSSDVRDSSDGTRRANDTPTAPS